MRLVDEVARGHPEPLADVRERDHRGAGDARLEGADVGLRVPVPRQLLLRQPGEEDPNRWITLAATEDRSWTIAYTPMGDAIPLRLAPGQEAKLRWFNPRTGEWSKATAVSGESPPLEPPSSEDWLASVRTTKEN